MQKFPFQFTAMLVTAVFSVCIVWKFTYWLQMNKRDLAVSMIMECGHELASGHWVSSKK
jgi:hypothetical protein